MVLLAGLEIQFSMQGRRRHESAWFLYTPAGNDCTDSGTIIRVFCRVFLLEPKIIKLFIENQLTQHRGCDIVCLVKVSHRCAGSSSTSRLSCPACQDSSLSQKHLRDAMLAIWGFIYQKSYYRLIQEYLPWGEYSFFVYLKSRTPVYLIYTPVSFFIYMCPFYPSMLTSTKAIAKAPWHWGAEIRAEPLQLAA